jgi:hypothetical protein
MAILDTVVRTISCDAFGCGKQVVFDRKEEKTIFEKPENVWLKTSRVIQTADGRNHVYCSDECELKGTATGKHNMPEPKKIIESGNAAAVAVAAQQATLAKQSEEALRSGAGGKIQVTDY